jgi:hypothetical protein
MNLTDRIMNRLSRALKAAVKGYKEGTSSEMTPAEYQGGGHHILCPQCANERFLERSAVFDATTTILTCHKCGFEQRFGKKPEKVEN